MTWWRRFHDSFWFLPGLFCLVGVVTAEGLVILDAELNLSLGVLDAVMYRVGASGSRGLLEAIATSVLAAAATSFSITIAVISLASSTYGPRLVRNFMADRGNQVVLGVYLATFLYSLLVLRTIRDDDGTQRFVPHTAVAFAVLLALVSVGVLVYFIHHISDSVQIWTLATRVRDDLLSVVDHAYPEAGDDSSRWRTAELPSGEGVPVTATGDGYVASIGEHALVALATERDLVLAMRIRPGSFCVRDSVLATAWAAPEAGGAAGLGDDVLDAVRNQVVLKNERTPYQDVEFAVQQVIELAVRALSPSTNDPYTALNAFDQLSAALARVVSRPQPSSYRFGPGGELRFHAPSASCDELIEMFFEAVRSYALDHPAVLRRAVEIADRTGARAERQAVREHLVTQLDMLVAAYEQRQPPAHDLERLRAKTEAVRERLSAPVT